MTEAAHLRPLIDAACPGADTGYATNTGVVTLQVNATGPWELDVAQQVDLPLFEPPAPAMTASTTVVAVTGSFYGIDQSGSGRAMFYRLTDGTYALRLDSFFVTPNIDLDVRLSQLPAPHSTNEYLGAPSVSVAPLDVTAGSINFTVPAGVDPTRYRSVVIWCPLIRSAYAAATLTPAH